MQIIDSLRKEMTSNSINKIMRTNLNLNSKILAKNTTEILNTCIRQLYKQMPKSFMMELHQGKATVTPKPRNSAPIERLKMQKRHSYRTIDDKSSIYRGQMSSGLMSVDQKRTPSKLSKKFEKTSVSKIYNSKHYCSSNSSSTGSLWQRYEDRNRLFRAYHTQSNYATSKSTIQKLPRESFASLAPSRYQYMRPSLATWRRAVEVSSHMKKDLMRVDEAIKDRLKMAAIKATKAATDKLNNDDNINTQPKSNYFQKPLKLNEEIMDGTSMANLQKQQTKSPKKEHFIGPSVVKPPLPTTSKKTRIAPPPLKLNSLKFGDNETKSNTKKTQNVTTIKRRATLRNCVPPEKKSYMKSQTNQNSNLSHGKSTSTPPSATYCLANSLNIKKSKYGI